MSERGAGEPRGGAWVVAQSAVIVAIVGLCLVRVRIHSPAVHAIGLALAALGIVLFGSAYHAMGRSFTPFPRPLPRGELVQSGPFRLVRHPIYGGLLLLLTGISLAIGIAGLAGTLVLAVLWWRKTIVEERLLSERFPGYPAYRERVRHRFLPWLL
jgi:protein-S-isoprenylcysteine O-methyltransferase Ste14